MSESELRCDWRFTANQFVLAQSPLRLTTSNFIFRLNICRYSSYVTTCLMRGWVCPLQLTTHVRVRVTLRLAVYNQSIHLSDKHLETEYFLP
jgi:hypothetical protein